MKNIVYFFIKIFMDDIFMCCILCEKFYSYFGFIYTYVRIAQTLMKSNGYVIYLHKKVMI